MNTAARYVAFVQEKLQEVVQRELPNIEKAADLVAESCRRGGRFYVFGTGHSHISLRNCIFGPGDWLWFTPSCRRR